MAFMFKPVYVLILSSIFSDVTNLGGRWCNSNQLAPDVKFIQPFSRIFPGADAQSLEETLFNAIVEEIAEDLLSGEKAFSDILFTICSQNYRTLALISTAY